MVTAPSLPVHRPPRTFTVHLANVFDSVPGHFSGIGASAFWRSLSCLQSDTGEPLQAIAGLQWWQVDLDRATLTIPRGSVSLFLSQHTVAALRAIESPRRSQVFPYAGGAAALSRAFHELTARAAVIAEKSRGDR